MTPTPPPDDWKPWTGGECPVQRQALVEYKLRGNAGTFYAATRAYGLTWAHIGEAFDIIAYRLAQSQKGGDVSCPEVAQMSSPGSNAAPKSNPSAAASDTPLIDGKVRNEARRLLGPVLRHDDSDIIEKREASHGCVEVQNAQRNLESVIAERNLYAERARLAEADVKRLREAVEKIMDGFDKGVFVRDTSKDAESGWAVRLLPFLAALSQARADSKHRSWMSELKRLGGAEAELSQLRDANAKLVAERDALTHELEHVWKPAAALNERYARGFEQELDVAIRERDAIEKQRDDIRSGYASILTERDLLRKDLCEIAEGCAVRTPDQTEAKRRIIALAAERDELRASLADSEAERGRAVLSFAQAILHGDEEHRAWLTAAAAAFIAGQLLPEPNGKGRAEAAEAERDRLAGELADLRAVLSDPAAFRTNLLRETIKLPAGYGDTATLERELARLQEELQMTSKFERNPE